MFSIDKMTFNKGIGYDPGASEPLGYSLGVCFTVNGPRKKELLVFLLFLSLCPIHISHRAWHGMGPRISPALALCPSKLGPQDSMVCVSPWATFLLSSKLCSNPISR